MRVAGHEHIPVAVSAEFEQIETLRAAQRDFRSEHAQVSPGRFRFRMQLADLGPLRVQSNAVEGDYLVRAEVRPGTWALFFPTGGPERASRMNGLRQGSEDAVLFGPGAEVHARVADGQRWTMAVLDDARFGDVLPVARAGGAVALPGLLAQAPGLLRLAEGARLAVSGAAASAAVIDGVRAEFDRALAGGGSTGRRLRGDGRAVRVTAAALAYLEAARGRAVFSEEIAGALGVTPRFVNLCFQAVYGTSLHQCLKLRRLAEARRRLRAGGDGLLVKQVALDLGMFHFGRFAAAYQAMYGETPSQTLARGAARGG